MIDESTKDFFHCFIIAVIGTIFYFCFGDKIDVERFGILSLVTVPFIILIATHFNRKTLLSFRFVKLCFYTFIFSGSIPAIIAVYLILTTSPHY